MLDVSGSMEGNLQLLRDGIRELFRRLRARRRAFASARSDTMWRSVRRSRAIPRSCARRCRARSRPTRRRRCGAPSTRGSTIFKNREEDDGRPVILVLSDGKDSGPIGFRPKFVSQVEVIDRARELGVMVYGIGMRSRGQRQQMPGLGPGGLQAALMSDWPDPGLARVAEETGGGYVEIRAGQDLGAAFAQVADELHSQYLLGFVPPKRDGKVHEIEVRTAVKGMKPRARKSYVAPKGAQA